jgi:beta-1,2-mannobiose phosphorylase / 1,2-beta-oligomannan phosphorylase
MMLASCRSASRVLGVVALFFAAIVSPLPSTRGQSVATPPARPAKLTDRAAAEFPPELVQWKLMPESPVFRGEGEGHWDVKIRERGWILKEGDLFRLWYTGYDGTHEGIKLLGLATSPDGLKWTRSPANPLVKDHWVEDVNVVVHDGLYYMFAEGKDDNHSELLTSKDGIEWKWIAPLDVYATDRTPAKRPCGTPTVWIENNVWYLFYEVGDKGVWLATTTDPLKQPWIKVQDDPVLPMGPGRYDKEMIAVDQILRHRGAYYAIFHGSGTDRDESMQRTWTTNIARSVDLVHWTKYPGNPIVPGDRSSGMVVPVAGGFRLYTMHDHVDVFESVSN